MADLIGANNCGNCKFSMKVLSEMVCRRHPPVGHPMMAMTQQGPQMIGKVGLQPPVQPNGWCGDYVRKLEVVPEQEPKE